jgi:cytochrome P450
MSASSQHVDLERPARLVNRRFVADPYRALTELRRIGAAVPVENIGFRMWIVTPYEDVKRILADRGLLRDLVRHRREVVAQNLLQPERRAKLPHRSRRSVLDRDGEDHKRLRAVLGSAFSPKRLAELRPAVQRLADDLLDAMPVGEPVDLVGRYSRPLAATAIADVAGIPPEYRSEFPVWETTILTGTSVEEIEEAGRDAYRFAVKMMELKRAEPGDDLFTNLLRAQREGAMDDDEVASTIILLLVGALEPTSAIANGLLALLTHPEQMARLVAEPDLLTGGVEEILRYETPFRILPPRYSDRAIELDGVTIPAGELILVSVAAANRDPGQFEDPDTFDVGRCPKAHLAFGHGAHRCLGAELGRIELAVGLGTLLRRFPNIRLAQPAAELAWRQGTFVRRLESLPVILG